MPVSLSGCRCRISYCLASFSTPQFLFWVILLCYVAQVLEVLLAQQFTG
ncbi:unnamed protein product [Musa acuminata subsp. malaccensis]|uniref:(wild Malaysian banana) hypothetical protein n=1 Tax=Musa acuminata subsp. malaccensis TaxID=214687 RepID=A0A804KY16_MUSAM|nr:unnamed protein product [Musa acuminata subsp. malaccensis]